MKRSLILTVIAGALLFSPLWALEIELTGGLNNMVFDPEQTSAYGREIGEFPGYTFIHGNLTIKDDISDKYSYNVRFNRDAILQNSVGGSVVIDLDYLNMEFGPFIGILNTPEQPLSAGISGGVKIAYPGIVFLGFKGSSTIGFKGGFQGDYSQEAVEANVGFWLPFIIPSASVNVKRFTRQEENSLLIRDELTRYLASADIFAKNSPFIFRLDFGYESLARIYNDKSSAKNEEQIDEVMAMFAGLEVKWQLMKMLRLIAGAEIPIYTWSEQPVRKMLNSDVFFYKFNAGIALTF
ncbi:MAG: hypothetical protein LBH44_05580 [Treponema sp.]|jgi:hypothetical protein|nr:hypothetical protein [Treponema sp.]